MTLILKIQPLFSASWLIIVASFSNSLFTSIISPSIGEYISEAAFTDSITHISCFALIVFPILGSSIKTISPKLSCAWFDIQIVLYEIPFVIEILHL